MNKTVTFIGITVICLGITNIVNIYQNHQHNERITALEVQLQETKLELEKVKQEVNKGALEKGVELFDKLKTELNIK